MGGYYGAKPSSSYLNWKQLQDLVLTLTGPSWCDPLFCFAKTRAAHGERIEHFVDLGQQNP